MSAPAAKSVFEAIVQNPGLEMLNIGSASAVKRFLVGKCWFNVPALCIEFINRTAVKALCLGIKPRMEQVDQTELEEGDTSEKLLETLAKNDSLVVLSMSNKDHTNDKEMCRLGETGTSIGKLIKGNKKLETLLIGKSNSRFCDRNEPTLRRPRKGRRAGPRRKSFSSPARSLYNEWHILTLYIALNSLGTPAIEAIAEGLTYNKTLESVDLSIVVPPIPSP